MLSHITVKKYIPVRKRVVTKETYWSRPLGELAYLKDGDQWWTGKKTSKPKPCWAVQRIRVRRAGQLNFFREILQ